jgi:hypothetical protein
MARGRSGWLNLTPHGTFTRYSLPALPGVLSEKGIGHALRRMNISYKKNLQHPKANEDKRHTFQETIKAYEAQNRAIVYIDESSFAHDMLRTHGYAPTVKRCHGVCNWHARGRVNVIKALIGKCLLTMGLFKSNINADTFFRLNGTRSVAKTPASISCGHG